MFDFEKQAAFISWMQNSKINFFHDFFIFCRHLDSMPFYFFILGLIAALLPRVDSAKYISLLCFCFYSNHLLKRIFDLPRPRAINSSLDLIDLSSHFGFPSGAAMGALIIAFIAVREFDTLKAYAFSILYIGVVSLSRVYLGVHFPIDILGGLFFGLILIIIFRFIEFLTSSDFFIANIRHKKILFLFIMTALLIIYPKTVSYISFSLTLGVLLAYDFQKKSELKIHNLTKILLALFGVFIVYLFSQSKYVYLRVFSIFALGLWLSYGYYRFYSLIIGIIRYVKRVY